VEHPLANSAMHVVRHFEFAKVVTRNGFRQRPLDRWPNAGTWHVVCSPESPQSLNRPIRPTKHSTAQLTMKTLKQSQSQPATRLTAGQLLNLRTRRLMRLLRLDAPDIVLAAELRLIAEAARELTGAQGPQVAVALPR
jgi:hypothetical protein